eukprot:7163430-Karenia_brevis.AAC.1
MENLVCDTCNKIPRKITNFRAGIAQPCRVQEIPGCVSVQDGSTGNMLKHLRRKLPSHSAPELQKFREAAPKGKSQVDTPSAHHDKELTAEYTHDVVLLDLQTVSLTDKTGAR